MFPAQDIVTRCKFYLDAEGTEYYLDTPDFIPAINSALEFLVTLLNPLIGDDKYTEEIFGDLTLSKVFQTSRFSRIFFDPALLTHDIWTILQIMPKPDVTIQPDANLAGLNVLYQAQINSSIGQTRNNAPVVSVDPFSGAPLLPFQSIWRPELAHAGGLFGATRLNLEEWPNVGRDPFQAGYGLKCDEFQTYAYLNWITYANTLYGGYQLNPAKELELKPLSPSVLATVFYIKVPTPVVTIADLIEFPVTLKDLLSVKALDKMGYKIGDGLYDKMTAKDIVELVKSNA